MSRFAKIDEQVLLRHKELTGENGKPAKETLFLYMLIVFHSFDGGICKKTLRELCEIYDLEYHNSARRVKILRGKGWIENTKKHLRPLIINKSGEDKKSVNSTLPIENKSVNLTPENGSKSVNSTPEKCKSYTKTIYKSVNLTPENGETSIPANEYEGSKTFKDLKTLETLTTTDSKTVVVDVVSTDSFSKFSFEEARRYVEICRRNGQTVKNPYGLALTLHQTGEADAFISATLYPEQSATEQTAAPDDERAAGGNLTEKEFDDALKLLIETRSEGFDVSDWEKFFTSADWARLNEEAKNYK